jgi:hypothetical protein
VNLSIEQIEKRVRTSKFFECELFKFRRVETLYQNPFRTRPHAGKRLRTLLAEWCSIRLV